MIAYCLYFYVALWPILLLIGKWKYEDTPTISVARILVLLLFAVITISTLAKRERISLGTPFYWLGAYIIWCVLNSFINPVDSIIRQIQMLLDTLILPCLGYVIIMNMKERVNFRVLVIAMALSGLLIAGIGIAEFIADKNLIGSIPGDPTWEVKLYRTNGPFHDGIVYAAVLVAYTPFISYFMEKKVLNKYIGLPCIAFVLFGSFLNFSKGASLSIVVILSILFYRNRVSRLLGLSFALALGAILLYLSLDLILSSTAYRVRSTDTSTAAARWGMYLYILDLVTTNLFTGIGYGNYTKTHIMDTHNSYLRLLIDYGLFGFIFFIGFIGSLAMKTLRRAYLKKDYALLRVKICYLFLLLFIPNTINLLYGVPFMTAFMIMTATIDLHFSESSTAALSPAPSLIKKGKILEPYRYAPGAITKPLLEEKNR